MNSRDFSPRLSVGTAEEPGTVVGERGWVPRSVPAPRAAAVPRRAEMLLAVSRSPPVCCFPGLHQAWRSKPP